MSGVRFQRSAGIVGALGAIFIGLSASSAAAAPVADSCGVLTQAATAKAFAQQDSTKHSSALRNPGNSAGVLQDRCVALAWKGKKPVGVKQERQGLLAGTASALRIETWVPDEGPAAETWRENFESKIKGLTSSAKRAFIQGGRGGTVIPLPTFGAEHSLGLSITTGGLVGVRAFWWDAGGARIVSVYAVEEK